MPSVWTYNELLVEIEATKAEIKARRGVSSYQLSTGMGNQSASNRSLKELMSYLDMLNSELESYGNDGLISIDFPRDIGGIY